MTRWRTRVVVVGLLLAVALGCSACLGGPPSGSGDPGNARLHAIERDALFAAPLPAGYRVTSRVIEPVKWKRNGWPLGQPGWIFPQLTEYLTASVPLGAVVAYFEKRAKAARWVDDTGASSPGEAWSWTKHFSGYTAGATPSPAGNSEYTVYLEAPPIGPTSG